MMPKGVEHPLSSSMGRPGTRVRIPMMPKGVEHLLRGFNLEFKVPVRIPMMPKGVEHLIHRGVFKMAARENSDDAERR